MSNVEKIKIVLDKIEKINKEASFFSTLEFTHRKKENLILYNKEQKLIDEIAELNVSSRLLSKIKFLPFTKAFINRSRAKVTSIEKEKTNLRKKIYSSKKENKHLLEIRNKLDISERNIRLIKNEIYQLGYPPNNVIDFFKKIDSQYKLLQKSERNMNWVNNINKLCDNVSVIIDIWYSTKKENEKKSFEVSKRTSNKKIYLPVPKSLWRHVEDLGALRDSTITNGTCPWYITLGMPISKFENVLPLAFRQNGCGFNFPPIPWNASGQNLHALFTKDTWDHIRRSSYEMVGRRCIICGKISTGPIARATNTSSPSVDAHEIWSWIAPDVSSGIGVQKLEEIIVVCKDCHAMFHEGYFRRLGADNSCEDFVSNEIEKRRALVNHTTCEAIEESVTESRAKLKELQKISNWVMDLSWLANQQHMNRLPIIMKSDTGSFISPNRIAGLTFSTDDGNIFTSKSVALLTSELKNGISTTENFDTKKINRL